MPLHLTHSVTLQCLFDLPLLRCGDNARRHSCWFWAKNGLNWLVCLFSRRLLYGPYLRSVISAGLAPFLLAARVLHVSSPPHHCAAAMAARHSAACGCGSVSANANYHQRLREPAWCILRLCTVAASPERFLFAPACPFFRLTFPTPRRLAGGRRCAPYLPRGFTHSPCGLDVRLFGISLRSLFTRLVWWLPDYS